MTLETAMTARRDGDSVFVTFYGEDQGRRAAARVVRTYCRTVQGRVTHRATFTGSAESNQQTPTRNVYRYTLTSV